MNDVILSFTYQCDVIYGRLLNIDHFLGGRCTKAHFELRHAILGLWTRYLPMKEEYSQWNKDKMAIRRERVCVCVWEKKCVWTFVCVCVCDWERKRERESVYVYVLKIERKRKCVCKCVCVFKRERDVGTVVRSNYSIAGCCVRRKRIEESLLSYSIPIVNVCRKKMIKFFSDFAVDGINNMRLKAYC